tara:strand:+ start:103 stop:402 length:300 start_codon:yes stop_codon:yes gene_type:complete
MKITETQLKKMIQEELEKSTGESGAEWDEHAYQQRQDDYAKEAGAWQKRDSSDELTGYLLKMMRDLGAHSELDIASIRERIEQDFYEALKTAENQYLGD